MANALRDWKFAYPGSELGLVFPSGRRNHHKVIGDHLQEAIAIVALQGIGAAQDGIELRVR